MSIRYAPGSQEENSQRRYVDRIHTSLGHGGNAEKVSIDVAHALKWCRRAPKNERGNKSEGDEVDVVPGDEGDLVDMWTEPIIDSVLDGDWQL